MSNCFRFSIRSLLVATALVAVGLLAFQWLRLSFFDYNWQLRSTREVFASHPELEIENILGNEDNFYKVEVIEFRIQGKPATISAVIPHGASYLEIRAIVEQAIESRR